MNQPERLKKYVADLEGSKHWRKAGYEDRWRLFRDMYQHRDPLFCGKDLKKDRVQVNYVHSTINQINASILHRYPKIVVTARNRDSFENSVIAEPVLNQQWQTKSWQKAHQLALLDQLIFGHGWIKTTYQFSRLDKERNSREFEQIFEEAKRNAIAVATDKKRPFATDEEVLEDLEEKGAFVLRDEVQVERVSPWDIFVDPRGRDMESICWVAQQVTVKRDVFNEDDRFPRKFRETNNIKSDFTKQSSDAGTRTGNFFDRGATGIEDTAAKSDTVTYYEFYDIIDGTLSFFLEGGGDDWLIPPKAMPYAFGCPFDMMRGTEVPDRFYPMGEVEIIADQQRELNEVRSAIINDRKAGRRQFLYKPDNVTAEFETAMESDAEDLLIPIKPNVEFGDVMTQLPYEGRVNPQLYDISALLQQDIFQLSGLTDYQRGGGASARTATQVAVENDAALARQAVKLNALELVMARTARRALQLMQQFMSTSDVVRLSNVGRHLGEDTDQFAQRYSTAWYEFSRRDIGGEFDVAIEAGSTRPVNDSTRAQQALQLVNATIPFVQLGIIDQAALATYVLREMGVPNPESWVQGGFDPRGAGQPQQQTQSLQPPSVAGGVPPVGGQVQPEQQPGQGTGNDVEAIRRQLQGQVGLG